MGSGLSDLFFSRVCTCCGKDLSEGESQLVRGLCRYCAASLPLRTPEHAQITMDSGCIAGSGSGMATYSAFVANYYEGFVRRAVTGLKFHDHIYFAEQLAEITYIALLRTAWGRSIHGQAKSWVLVPIPLSDLRLKERGYNQSALIGQGLAARLEVDFRQDLLRRTKHTGRQSEMPDRHSRLKNVSGAFVWSADELLLEKNILLLDDVTSTGATLMAAASAIPLPCKNINLLAVAGNTDSEAGV